MLNNILTEEQELKLRQIVQENERIVITCHKSPDGDALGSSLAWAAYLQSVGKEPVIVVPDQYPDFLQWLPNTEKIVRYDKHQERAEMLLSTADTIYCMDMNTPSRVNDMEQALTNAKARKVMIDHHLEPQMDTVLTVSHSEMSSTCEVVFRLIWQLGAFDSMDKKWASCIYCGMMTDTGAFTFNSNSPDIFFIIGQLLTKQINKDRIYRKVYNNYSPWAIRFRGYIMCQKLNVFEDLNACYFAISKEDMRRFRFNKGDAEGLVNEPLRIKGMRLSISLREDDRHENLIWVSLRSVEDFPCNKMAEEYFNGGGHMNASGGRLNCTLEEAQKTVIEAIRHYGDQLKS
ncbi:MAG: DHH family phosphoesterase [Prevotella sp.]|nr:DHH family phosphoesterase [Prevotella sp.]